VGLITNLENVILRYEAESRMGRLKIIDCLTHISLGSEYQRSKTIIIVFDLSSALLHDYTYILSGANLFETLHDFCIPQFRVPQDRTSRLNRLDNLVGHVAR